MKFGVHSFVWNDAQETATIEAGMERARAAGFDFFELPGFDRRRVDVGRVARRAEALGLELGASCGLAPEFDVSSDDPAVVAAGEAVLNEAVAIARDLGSKGLSGPIFSGHQKYRVMPTRRNWDTSVAVLARVAERAKAAGVALSMELVNRYETNLMNTVRQGLAYIRDSGSDNLYLHVDTFHMNIEEDDMGQAIRLGGDRIGYFHVGESNRGYLGSGSIDFARAFDALVGIGYDRAITVEAFNVRGCGDWLKAICAIWRENWTDADAFARAALDFMRARWDEALRRAAAYR
ncbi:MAG: sugar phosphate isomerase/epimerase [Rhodobacteraceae bacterium]|nr:sugar phosphate isomerase/epimerase [Paracoccaceae bacterium]